jgi:acyl-CoA reductase-like NAD-dependent aldehyde dehydrogenase
MLRRWPTVGDNYNQGFMQCSSVLSCLPCQLAPARPRSYIQSGLDEGATLACGGLDVPAGLDRGLWVAPTVFTDVAPSMRIVQRGP